MENNQEIILENEEIYFEEIQLEPGGSGSTGGASCHCNN